MSNSELLIEAIDSLKQISFEYNKPGKVRGIRVGNPYILFLFKSKAGIKSSKIHIVQTGGVSDSNKSFPSFRLFDLKHMSNIRIFDNSFTPNSKDYKPNSIEYLSSEIIAKV